MKRNPQDGRDSYRLIVTRRKATELLITVEGRRTRLPRVNVRPGERPAIQLREGVRNIYGIDAYCLFVPRLSEPPGTTPSVRYAVMESVEHNAEAPTNAVWMRADSIVQGNTLTDKERHSCKASLEEMDRYVLEPRERPFAGPGWIHELFAWTREIVGPLEIPPASGFQQLNAGPSFSLIRIETTERALWFKATGEPNLHELPITHALACLFPGYVPELLGVHQSWNAWLSRECDGATLDSFEEVSAWTRTAKTLARLEIASIGKHSELLKCGCRDLTPATLVRQIDPFLARTTERMHAQKKQPPPILSSADIAFLREELKQACRALQELNLPDVLGHLDFNPGNIVVSRERSTFLDWAEGALTSPFITFAYLREHALRSRVRAKGMGDRMCEAYLEPWRPLLCPSDLARCMELSSIVAVYAYALAMDSKTSLQPAESPEFSGFLRSLARRIYREAVGIRGRSGLCRP